MDTIHYPLILLSALVAIASPGPATLAIAGTSMSQGRKASVTLALGILTGSFFWSTTAAFGLGAVLQANVWLFEVLRYIGALYLLFLAYKSFHSMMKPQSTVILQVTKRSYRAYYIKGLLLHLTNPKAILFFGALYSVGIPNQVSAMDLVSVILSVGAVSASVFLGYAVLFSSQLTRQLYAKTRRASELLFGATFGFAGLQLLLHKITQS
ncbi:LysE family translocator [Vibrio tritonius]|uniref:LysE family translocator n=1 Tax=Vibrio tritonius TaxID=1435069 RepID=UPI00315DC4DD